MRIRSASFVLLFSLWASVGLFSACGDDSGPPAPQKFFGTGGSGGGAGDAGGDLPEAGPGDAGDAGSDAALASPIHGTSMVHHVKETGETIVPVDLTSAQITAWAPDGTGGFTKFAGKGAKNGTFDISAEVPAGSYTLGMQPASAALTLTVETSHTPAFDAYKLGRPDASEAATGTVLVFDVTGLHPWQDADDLVLFSPNAGAIVFSPHLNAATGAPKAGDTVLSGMGVDYAATYTGTGLSPHLIEGAKGDIAYLDQLVHGAMPGASTLILGAYCVTAPFTQANGMSASLGCALKAVLPTQTFGIKMKRASFEGQIVNVHPSATFFESEVVLRAMPAANAHGLYSGSPELVIYEPDPGAPDLDAAVGYGNPFPAGWDLYATYLSAFNVPVLAPGASTPKVLHLRVRNDVPLSSVGSAPIGPIVTPPKALRINGADAFKAQTGVTTSPTVSWQPPDVGLPDSYDVILHRLTNKNGATVETVAARLKTPDTHVTFPPGALVMGQAYVIEVLAAKGQGLPFGSASTVSSLLTP